MKYGVEYTLQSKEVRNKINQTMIEKYGEMYPLVIHQKMIETLYITGRGPISNQQKYLHNLYNGKLNYPVGNYMLDIAFLEANIYVEYSGGGHNLSVKMGSLSQEEFNQKEIIRNNILRRKGWKKIEIISPNDKLPSDEILLQMLDISKQYFKDYPNHSWFEWLIDDGIYKNAEHKDGVLFNYGELRYIKVEDIQGNSQSSKTA